MFLNAISLESKHEQYEAIVLLKKTPILGH